MKNEIFMCMALECKNEVKRHPYAFETGFCDDCKDVYNQNVKQSLIQ